MEFKSCDNNTIIYGNIWKLKKKDYWNISNCSWNN